MDQPAPPTAFVAPTVPACIGAVLRVVRVLLGYGRQLDETLTQHAAHPRFPTLAAGFGTHDMRRILAHVQRGILRAMMLERYLLARAAQGRDIDPTPLPAPAEADDIAALDLKLRPPSPVRAVPRRRTVVALDDAAHFSIPTLKELEAQVRGRSVGRTIADICLDLGIAPGLCDGGFWHEVYQALRDFGDSFAYFFAGQQRRLESFRKERQRYPDTWTIDWRDRPREAIRQMLGHAIGEPGIYETASA